MYLYIPTYEFSYVRKGLIKDHSKVRISASQYPIPEIDHTSRPEAHTLHPLFETLNFWPYDSEHHR
jgi:hypothetical protein